MTVLEGKSYKEAIKVKQCHNGGALILWDSVLIKRGIKESFLSHACAQRRGLGKTLGLDFQPPGLRESNLV